MLRARFRAPLLLLVLLLLLFSYWSVSSTATPAPAACVFLFVSSSLRILFHQRLRFGLRLRRPFCPHPLALRWQRSEEKVKLRRPIVLPLEPWPETAAISHFFRRFYRVFHPFFSPLSFLLGRHSRRCSFTQFSRKTCRKKNEIQSRRRCNEPKNARVIRRLTKKNQVPSAGYIGKRISSLSFFILLLSSFRFLCFFLVQWSATPPVRPGGRGAVCGRGAAPAFSSFSLCSSSSSFGSSVCRRAVAGAFYDGRRHRRREPPPPPPPPSEGTVAGAARHVHLPPDNVSASCRSSVDLHVYDGEGAAAAWESTIENPVKKTRYHRGVRPTDHHHPPLYFAAHSFRNAFQKNLPK